MLDGTQTATITASSPGFVSGADTLDVTDATVEVNLEVSTATATESGQTVVTVTARTLSPTVGSQTLDLNVSGTGITSGDYVLSGTTITIPDNQTSGSVTFTVVDDAVVESLVEAAVITMGNLTNGLAAGATPSQTVSITDNDSATISIDDVALAEGDSGNTTFTFTVTLLIVLDSDRSVDTGVSVDFATADDTATTTDGDYSATGGTLNFSGQAGETQTISVSITGDQKVELNESFLVDLSNLLAGGRDVTFADDQGQGMIINDDSATLSIDDVALNEGDSGDTIFTFTVTLDSDVGLPVGVDFDTAEGTATAADSDFTPVTGGLLGFCSRFRWPPDDDR